MKIYQKYILLAILFAFSCNLHSQTPREILLNNTWETLLGNHLKFTTDSIQFDGRTIGLKGRKSKLTDSSFICTQEGWGPDTVFYFKYSVNNDSLKLNFLPLHVEITDYGLLNCSFSDRTFCQFINKDITFYSKSYLKKANKTFKLKYIETKISSLVYLKLFNDGRFVFSTKGKAVKIEDIHPFGYRGSKKIRILDGLYSGKLSSKTMDTIQSVLRSDRGLKSYLHISYHPTESGRGIEFLRVVAEHNTIPVVHYPLKHLAEGFIAFKPLEIYFHGANGKMEKIKVLYDSKVLPPDGNFYNGYIAVSGHITFIKTLKVGDSTNYVYQMKIENYPSKIDKDFKVGDVVPFISRIKIKTDSIGLMYQKKIAHYHDLNWTEKWVKYNLAVDTFSLSENIIFEYIDKKNNVDNQKIKRLETRNKRYPLTFDKYKSYLLDQKIYPPKEFFSKMDYKIARTLNRLERLE